MYEETRFSNGLQLLTVHMPHAYSASIGTYLGVGSRYEDEHLAGSSHFVEHMLFKGTARRPTPREIALSIEGIGGVLNASTGHEMTTYWAKVGRTHLPIAVDTLLDMVRNSRFHPDDVEKERGVILEEISESMDIPEEVTYHQLQALLWPNHALGRDIAGSHESVESLSRDDLLGYMQHHYGPGNAVIAIASAWDHEEVRQMVAPHVEDWEQPTNGHLTTPPKAKGPRVAINQRPIEQGHLCLAVHALHRQHPDRYALHVLNALLGEGMSSRLFIQIRERLGLAYTVYSDVSLLLDSGAWVVYAAVEPPKLNQAVEAVVNEWDRLCQEPVAADELHSAREYVKGRLLLHLEDTAANSSWVGTQAVLGLPITRPEETLLALDAVTSEDLLRVARDVLHGNDPVLSIVSPHVPPEAAPEWEAKLHFRQV